MRRVNIPELEDQRWFPSWLRTSMTNLIVVMSRLIGADEALTTLVSRILKEQRMTQVVDLGSGAGGVMPEVIERVRREPELTQVTLLMTDLYPNDDAVERFNDPQRPHLRYRREAVDATDFAAAPPGLKTMTNCFHHMPPDVARHILKSAHDHRQPLLIYEMAENNIPFILWLLFLPLGLLIVGAMSLLLTPFVRPVSLRQLFFTYLIPIIPVFYAWDGQASMPRIYAQEDVDELLAGLDDPEYRWERGPARSQAGRAVGQYLLGVPVSAQTDGG